jgi:hypothetical protein
MKKMRILLALVLGVCAIQAVHGHRFAPSLLKVIETAPQQYNMVWKTPAQGVSNVPLEPVWPEACEAVSASPPQLEDTGVVTSWQLQCLTLGEEGLVGETLGVSGLGASQASAIVMVSLLDGRQYQRCWELYPPRYGAHLDGFRSSDVRLWLALAGGRWKSPVLDHYCLHRGAQHHIVTCYLGLS